ncbi:AAA-domain-containing protein [Testicularia cyperi]|uniref:Peroxisomal ATPase PEX1 n=1 Tax=Testicularia cyperi TaxID=1882483 RepID=A0A317XLG6_9BASI|nr:AAA-domain-containing protein [Testicularia cyperi]
MSRQKGKGRSAKSTLVRVQFDPSLKSSLVHLPVCLYAPLVDLAVPPQSLVVEIDPSPGSDSEARPYYAGWSGMSAAPLSVGNSVSHNGSMNGRASVSDVLNLSPSLAASFSPPLREGTTCSVRLLRSPPLPTAVKIDVTPLSADDWEILSLHAEEVEMNMLGQVRAARTGQVLAVHVGRAGNTLVRFRVDSTTPSTSGSGPESADTAAAQEDDAPSHGEAAGIAVRLSTDTEVIIAPRLRKKVEDPATQEKHELHPSKNLAHDSSNGTDNDIQQLRQSIPKLLWRVLPARFAEGVDLGHASNAVVLPGARESVTFGYAQVQQIYSDGRLSVTKVSCPTNNAASEVSAAGREKSGHSTSTSAEDDNNAAHSSGSIASTPQPTRPTASARFLDLSTLSSTISESKATVARLWPDRHVLIGPALRQQLGIKDYDLIRIGPPPPGSIAARASAGVSSRNGTGDATAAADEEASSDTELAGVDQILQIATDAVAGCFKARRLHVPSTQVASTSSSSKPFLGSSCLLLTGAPGSGKTVIAKKIASRFASDFDLCLSTSYFDCSPFAEERVPVLRARFSEWLNEAAWKSPSLLILDNIDRIIPAEVEHVESQRARQLAEAFVSRVRDCVRTFGVFVVATAQSNTSLHALLNSSHIWIENLQLKPPRKEGRREILAHLVRQKASLASATHTDSARLASEAVGQDLNYVTLATQTEGYLPADLRDLVERATHQAAIRAIEQVAKSPATTLPKSGISTKTNGIANGDVKADNSVGSAPGLPITMDDFIKAQDGFTPLSLRDVKLEKSSVAWSDIGGLIETRRVLRETLEWPTKYAAIFASCPLRLRSGLLLYGYPGCGKTLLASAVAKECGLNFISVKGPEILNKYIGASEKSVRDLFDRAQAAKPCVLFFDEFDSIAPKRGHDSTGVTDRVVNQMLTQMDGAEGLDGVYVLAATSRPDLIDSALLRPGRLDKSLLCDMPTKEDRVDIMRAISLKVHLDPSVDLEKWADRTEGFSGADLQALLYNAHLEAIHESINTAAPQDSEKEDKSAAGQGLKFVQFGGGKSSGASKTLSGAEKQALTHKLELVMQQSQQHQQQQHRSARARSDRVLGDLDAATDGKAAVNGGHVTKGGKSKTLVRQSHLETSIKSTRPSVPLEEQLRLRRIYKTFAGDRDGHFPDGEASQEIGARSSLM